MFDGSTETFKCNVKNISLKHLVEIVRNTTRKAIITALPTTHNNIAKDLE